MKLTRAVAGALIEAFTRAVPKGQGTHACPRASWAGVWLWRAPEGARLAHAGRYDINHFRGQQFVCQFARKFELLAGDHVSKNECVQTKISILFAVELGFSLSLPSAITHEAYVSDCRRAERAIAERQAIFHLGETAQKTASRPQFLQRQAIATGHISIMCRLTGDISSVSSRVPAGAL